MLERFGRLRSTLLAPFLFNVNPAVLTIISFILACYAGYLFFISYWALGAFVLLVSSFLDALDGEIARKYKSESKFGDLLDHTLDRLADVAIFVGLAFNPLTNLNPVITLLALIAVLLASYAGTQAQALTNKRLYTALIGRADRLIILFLAAIAMQFYTNAMFYAILVMGLLSVLTFFQRTIQTALILKR